MVSTERRRQGPSAPEDSTRSRAARTTVALSFAIAALCVPATPARAAQDSAKPAADSDAIDAASIERAWSFLLPSEQEEAAAYLREACRHLGTFQQGLIDYARSLDPRDASQFPAAPPTPFYAPDLHAPGQPIARKRLDEQDPRARKLRELVFAPVPATGLASAWTYDWAAREVQRSGDDLEPRRIFFNALAGYPPDLDLAQAQVLRALDDGAEQAALAALGHAYTDRRGSVYPGVTLYDAWSSGAEIEMPDVDILGIVHDLANDWKTYVAPVPDSQHDELYARVFAFYHPAKRHRGLRTALAMTFLSGSIPLRDGYSGHRDRLHTWWDEHDSTPSALFERLPKAADWATFMESWSARIDRDAKATERGIVRRSTLDADAAAVRKTAIAILREFRAFERKERPTPPPPRPAPLPPEPPRDG